MWLGTIAFSSVIVVVRSVLTFGSAPIVWELIVPIVLLSIVFLAVLYWLIIEWLSR